MAEKQKANLRMVAWEVTRSCNLSCRHCRASSERGPYPDELSTKECFKVIDEISSFANPIIILTGGEPLLRKDIFEIAAYGNKKGLRMVMAPNGTLLNEENVKKIIASGIKRISVSLDGPDAVTHDDLRQVPGAFKGACDGIERAKKAGLEFQINTTVTKKNVRLLPRIMKLAIDLGAKAHHIFLLVPTGRGKDMVDEELSAAEYEETLKALAKAKESSPIEMKITCAPHFNRILLEGGYKGMPLAGRGCMAGVSFCFISHTGELQPCGYLEAKCGNVRDKGFKHAWDESSVFNDIRDWSVYKGKCGICEFKTVCGGCRARAYARESNYLGEEPYCAYEPKSKWHEEYKRA
ncbi:MAG: radical SAM/SPASM domain-containing protein [Candidatus Omnitrophica bacterium CG1_02_49_10]|nr:MAG: radical SAM/SPASM domain-containing protein [Candidatus Omnitrophica bacterium CG1_02_49_10]